MFYRSFRFTIITAVSVIIGLTFLFAFLVTNTPSFFIPFTVLVIIITVVTLLIRYIERTNKDLTHFLLSIKQNAFTEFYPSLHKGTRFEEFSSAMREIITEFAKLNSEKELHYQFLQTLNENINVAILSFNPDGKLLLANSASKKLLNTSYISQIHHIKRIDESLYDTMTSLQPENSKVIRIVLNDRQVRINIQVKEIILNTDPVRIFLLQNLSNEFEENELEAWSQLVQVLTHELMNSVTPITSLAHAMKKILTDEKQNPRKIENLSQENIDDVYNSLATLSNRSSGLLKFIHSYRELSKGVEADLRDTDLTKLVRRILVLVAPNLDIHSIEISVTGDDSPIIILSDESLIEQVLINLIKNAMDAVPHDGSGKISIQLSKGAYGKVTLKVQDNGSGIEPELLQKIFVPFFTTKPGGSGIGLSFSRQVMKYHQGTIFVQSTLNKGTVFTLEFRS